MKQKGFSLLEVMIAAGMIGVVSLGVMQITKQAGKTSRKISQDFSIFQVQTSILDSLTTKDACQNTVAASPSSINLSTAAGTTFNSSSSFCFYDSRNAQRLCTGSAIGSGTSAIYIDEVTFSDHSATDNSAQVQVTLIRNNASVTSGSTEEAALQKRTLGPIRKVFSTTIFVDLDGSGAIANCFGSADSAREQVCSDLGGTYDPATGCNNLSDFTIMDGATDADSIGLTLNGDMSVTGTGSLTGNLTALDGSFRNITATGSTLTDSMTITSTNPGSEVLLNGVDIVGSKELCLGPLLGSGACDTTQLSSLRTASITADSLTVSGAITSSSTITGSAFDGQGIKLINDGNDSNSTYLTSVDTATDKILCTGPLMMRGTSCDVNQLGDIMTRNLTAYGDSTIIGRNTINSNTQIIGSTQMSGQLMIRGIGNGSLAYPSHMGYPDDSLFYWMPSKSAIFAGRTPPGWSMGTGMGARSAAFGDSVIASGNSSFVAGVASAARGIASIALGNGAEATASAGYSFVTGSGAEVSANNAIAMGRGMSAGGDSSVGIGRNGTVTGAQSILLSATADTIVTRPNVTASRSIVLSTGTWNSATMNKPNDIVLNGTTWTPSGGLSAISDKRTKTRIQKTDYGLHEILNLPIFEYFYKEELMGRENSEDKRIGVMAQDVQKLVPEAVDDNGEYLGVRQEYLFWLGLRATQEQQVIIDSQQKRIKTLEKRINRLEKILCQKDQGLCL